MSMGHGDIHKSRTAAALRDTPFPKFISGEIHVPYAEKALGSNRWSGRWKIYLFGGNR